MGIEDRKYFYERDDSDKGDFTYKNRKRPVYESLKHIYKNKSSRVSPTETPRYKKSRPEPLPLWFYILFFFFLLFFVSVVASYCRSFSPAVFSPPRSAPASVSAPAPVPVEPSYSMSGVPENPIPETSVFSSSYPPSVAVAPFSFVVPPNSEHYFIKLKDSRTFSFRIVA